MLGLVEEWVEQDQLDARVYHLAQAARAGVRGAGDGKGLQTAQPEVRVEPVQLRADSPARALSVVVEGDIDALGDPERAGVPSSVSERLPNDRHLLGELFRRG